MTFKHKNKKIDEARGVIKAKRSHFKKFENTIKGNDKYKNNYEIKAAKLKMQGNPWKLTPITYYLLKLSSMLVIFINGIYSKRNIFLILLLSIIAYFFVDLIYWLSNKDDNNKIKRDLPDIYDMLNIQTSAEVPLGLALTEIYDIASCKRLKSDLMALAAEINIRKNPDIALDNFRDKYDLLEIDNFVLTIKQSLCSGKSKEMLNNQGDMLKENNIFDIQEETGKIDIKFFFIAMLLFIGLAFVIIFSFMGQIQGDVKNIFK